VIENDRGNFTIEVLNLDAVADFEQRLGSRLPANEKQALLLVGQRIAKIGQSELNTELRHAYQALSVAMSYGVGSYPAIIIDQQVILYGVTDLTLAIEIYRLWEKTSRERVTHE
jgi:integrating conjugative element protein (TIGR03757 family)